MKSDHKHVFVPSEKHKDYEVCVVCDSYHSTALMDRVELYENEYWDEKNGHSFFGDQIGNLTLEEINGVAKVEKILSYVKKSGVLLEIGCAPGVILNRTRRRGHSVYGIEPDVKLIPEILKVAQCEPERIIHGYFPEVKLPVEKFDHIIAMDLIEHLENYREVIKACYDLLNHDGKLIIMLPLIKNGAYRERDFAPHEHAYIFTYEYMADFLCSIFEEVLSDTWQPGGHEIFVAKKIKLRS